LPVRRKQEARAQRVGARRVESCGHSRTGHGGSGSSESGRVGSKAARGKRGAWGIRVVGWLDLWVQVMDQWFNCNCFKASFANHHVTH
jgi:hypothetical protein